ncbi:uncharacterized protein LOC106776243 isoform X1 [Vigna radiata var. radiata]|uniref:Uncharacterized protein LOC106776243 isoform X1 n=1 Tax=Vigna radiata var. radiata TaxID=3916 RepID=A0A1S3VLE8_VIGRR|nr:uncharacterized protein LOC106776243 isoform X1 [Vigna radiata var. radiata]
MMKNQGKHVTSLTTTRLSPLAKPFTLNRSTLQPCSNSLFSGYPFLESPKKGDFDGFGEDFSLPTYSPLGHGKQGEDSHESLFANGSDLADSTMFKEGNQAVHGLSPFLTESASTGTVVAESLLSNSKGTTLVDDESSIFPLFNCKVSSLKSLTTDMSSAKHTSLNQSSTNLVENDSDVDSPCWKGTMAFCQTPVENSGSIQTNNVEKATEKHNSLNPLAPQFFPRIAYVKDDFGSSNSGSPVATNVFPGEHMLKKTVMAESPVELNTGIDLQPSSNTCRKEKASNTINDPKNSYLDPALNLHCKVTQPSSKEDCSMSIGKLEAVVDADNFAERTKDPRVCRSISDAFTTKSCSPISTLASSSSRVAVVTDLLKTFEGISKSLSKAPTPDVGIVVSAIHVLSELLVQTSMDGVGPNNEHGHDEIMIEQIINNLNDFSAKRCVQRISTLESTADNPFCHNRSLELPKGLEMTSIENLNDPNKLHSQNDYTKKKTVYKMFGQSGKSFLAPSSDKGHEIAQLQVIRRSLGKKLDFDKHMHPEALLFLNLWLDSEAERCFSKYETYHCLMEAGLDVNCTTVAELLS